MREVEPDLRANFEVFKRGADHRIAMEVNIHATAICDEAIVAEEFRDQRARLRVRLHFMPLTRDKFLELSLHLLERIVDDLRERLVHLVLGLLFVCHQLMSGRYREVDSDAERIAGTLLVVRLFDRDIAAADVIAKAIEPCRFAANQVIDFI